MFLKNILKRFLPPSSKTFHSVVEQLFYRVTNQDKQLQIIESEQKALSHQGIELLQAIQSEQKALSHQGVELLQAIQSEQKALSHQGIELLQAIQSEQKALSHQGTEIFQAIQSGQNALLHQVAEIEEQQKKVFETIEDIQKLAKEGQRSAMESVWAQVFNQTISNSTWLLDKSFSPGRWAVGYPYLYAMYRVLDDVRPQSILELGLGQSTRMITQYASTFQNVQHIVVEHDEKWIDFFQHNVAFSSRSTILRLDIEMVPYKEAEQVRVYKGFKESLSNKKYDFFLIDAPLSGDMKNYARIDLLGLLPQCLENNFVIMIDDTERRGVYRALGELETCLQQYNVKYRRGLYSGLKNCVLLASEEMAFLTSL